MPTYDVLIATPGKLIHAEYVESLVETIKILSNRGLSYKFLNKQSSFIPSGRELVATDTNSHNWDTREIGSGQYTYGKIVWVDSDIVWEPSQFMQILDSDEDIISGLYATTAEGVVACSMFHPNLEGEFPVKAHESNFFMQTEPVEVFGVGFGFVAMKQGVFEKCDRPWFKIEQIKWPELDFTTNVGEDYSWCINARRNGFKIMLDPTIRVKHAKEAFYELPPA
jgi:hypothetical protein